jgi:uncharacterized protein YqhQ
MAEQQSSGAERRNRVGGMALANGLLVHGPEHWAAAVRDDDGRLHVASGTKPRIPAGPLARVPLVRGIIRLGEALAVVPAARRELPQARLAMEDTPVGLAMLGSAALATVVRRRLPSVALQESVGAIAGLVPALIALRGSSAATWHGVEHKSIAAYEAGGAHADAADQAKEHDRCGGNLIMPLVVSTTIGNVALRHLVGRPTLAARLGVSALSLGVAVETFAFAARRPEHPLSRVVHRAGHWVQAGFSTREPDEAQLSVGRAAMDALLRAEAAPTA